MYRRTILPALCALGLMLTTAGDCDAGSAERSVEVLHGGRRSTTTWKSIGGRSNEYRVETKWDREPAKEAEPEQATEEAAAALDAADAADTEEGASETEEAGTKGKSRVTGKTRVPSSNGTIAEVQRAITR
jgi:hypothetical protein